MAAGCPYCGWPEEGQPAQTVSRHRTGDGDTVWTRCRCGSLQARVLTPAGVWVATRSRPAPPWRADEQPDGADGQDAAQC